METANILDFLKRYSWAWKLFAAVMLLLALNYVLKKLVARSKDKAEDKKSDWRFYIDYAAIRPAKVLLWLLLVAFVIDIFGKEFGAQDAIEFVAPIRNVAVIFCLAWFLLRWKKVFHKAMSWRQMKGKTSFDPVSIEIMGKLFTVLVVFISLLIVLQVIGLNIAPLVTFGGIGAAILGIASKDVVANFFGGMMIYITRPFTANDFIELPDKGVLATIEEIGWYFTSVRDLNKKPAYIPNSVFSTSLVVNWSRMSHRRVDEVVKIRMQDEKTLLPILEEVRTFLAHHKGIDAKEPIYVAFQSYTTYCLEVLLQAYTISTRYDDFLRVKQEVLLGVYEIIEKAGAKVAVPYSEVSVFKQ